MATIDKIKLGNTIYSITASGGFSISENYTNTVQSKVVYSISSDGYYYTTSKLSLSSLTCSSEIQATGFYATSDQRLKRDIKNVDAKDLIQTFDQLSPKYFYFTNDKSHKEQVGLIAQDLEKIVPSNLKDGFINKNENGYLSINETKLIYLCIEKIKQLEKEIQELKNK